MKSKKIEKPKIDLDALRSIYGSDDKTKEFDANPSLGTAEIVRIGKH